jgi:hypothetical protein
MKRTILALALVLAGCQHTPEPDEVYKSLVSVPGLGRFSVIIVFVGRNWEIKDAVNAHKISDAPMFHTTEFWGNPSDQQLVVYRGGYLRLEAFLKQFKRVTE